jgi:hypothetical protein
MTQIRPQEVKDVVKGVEIYKRFVSLETQRIDGVSMIELSVVMQT